MIPHMATFAASRLSPRPPPPEDPRRSVESYGNLGQIQRYVGCRIGCVLEIEGRCTALGSAAEEGPLQSLLHSGGKKRLMAAPQRLDARRTQRRMEMWWLEYSKGHCFAFNLFSLSIFQFYLSLLSAVIYNTLLFLYVSSGNFFCTYSSICISSFSTIPAVVRTMA